MEAALRRDLRRRGPGEGGSPRATIAGVGEGALAGVRVLELGLAIAAPHCAQILADHGADVIRVEPLGGDKTRFALPHIGGESLYFAAHNRAKRSIAIDLKAEAGREAFLRLADTADVVVTNFGAEVPDRLGVGYEVLSARNPGIVMAHITGFGTTGEERSFGAYDGIIQSMSGVASVTGTTETGPTMVGPFVADHVAAMQAVIAILLALTERATTGRGTMLDLSMLDGYTSVLAHHVGEALDLGVEPEPSGNMVTIAFANTFPAADGLVYVAPLAPDAWRAFCEATELPDWVLAADRRFILEDGRPLVEEAVARWTRTRSRDEIVRALRAVGVPCGPVNSVGEAVRNPLLWSRGALTKVRTPRGQEVSVPGPPVAFGLADTDRGRRVPAAGEHTCEVLRELGYDEEALAALLARSVIADPGAEPATHPQGA